MGTLLVLAKLLLPILLQIHLSVPFLYIKCDQFGVKEIREVIATAENQARQYYL